MSAEKLRKRPDKLDRGDCMKIDTTIVDAYLNSEDVSKFSSLWLYTDRTECGIENVFQIPPDEEAKRRVVFRMKEEIVSYASTFVPCNSWLWDTLFADWRNFLDSVTLDLIVGYPNTNDASVKQAPDGKQHMIFDLLCWEKYLGVMPLSDLSQNLLTHELFHVMVAKCFPDIEDVEMRGEYAEQLDAIAFNEGFAHLVSYKRQEIDTVSWGGEELTAVYRAAVSKMKNALQEKSPERQKQYIYDANFGKYYDKYACMCGMIYLGRQWKSGGAPRLKELFRQGYRGFAAKSAGL